jgi:hypothetical protein
VLIQVQVYNLISSEQSEVDILYIEQDKQRSAWLFNINHKGTYDK